MGPWCTCDRLRSKGKAVLSPNLPQTALGRPESCPGSTGPACTHAGLGEGGRSPHAFSLAQLTSRVTVLFKVGPLYDSWSRGQRAGKKRPPSLPSPCIPLLPSSPGNHPPPLETIQVKTVQGDDSQNNWPGLAEGFKLRADELRAGGVGSGAALQGPEHKRMSTQKLQVHHF